MQTQIFLIMPLNGKPVSGHREQKLLALPGVSCQSLRAVTEDRINHVLIPL